MSLDFTRVDQAVEAFEKALYGLFEGLEIDDRVHLHRDRIANGICQLHQTAVGLQNALTASGLEIPDRPTTDCDPPPLVVYPPDTLPVLIEQTLRFTKAWLTPRLHDPEFWRPGIYDFQFRFHQSLAQLRYDVFDRWRSARHDYERRKAVALIEAAREAESGGADKPAGQPEAAPWESPPAKSECSESQSLAAVIRTYTGGVSEERIRQIASIAAQKTLSARERLKKFTLSCQFR